MSSGLALFQKAETFFHQGHTNDAFEYCQKPIKKILKDENVIAKIPAIMPPDFPPTGGVALHQSTASHDLFLLSNY